jgi:hypothetical protein
MGCHTLLLPFWVCRRGNAANVNGCSSHRAATDAAPLAEPGTTALAATQSRSSPQRAALAEARQDSQTATGKEVALDTRPATLWSKLLATRAQKRALVATSSSTFSLPRSCLADTWWRVNLFTTSTGSGTTTALRTSNCGHVLNPRASELAMLSAGHAKSTNGTWDQAHLQRCSRSPLSTLGGGGNRTRVLQPLPESSPSAASDYSRPPARHWHRPTARANLGFLYGRLAQPKSEPRIMTPATDPPGWGQTDDAAIKPRTPKLALLPCYRHLLFSQLFNVASGDHGSLLSG